MSSTEVPYYLAPNQEQPSDVLFSIPIFSTPQMPGVTYTPESVVGVWESLKDSTTDILGDVKDLAGDALGGIKNTVTGFYDAATERMGNVFSGLQKHILLMIGLFLVIIVVIAKSGLLKQLAPIIRDVMRP